MSFVELMFTINYGYLFNFANLRAEMWSGGGLKDGKK
jgi:hypothetical protein